MRYNSTLDRDAEQIHGSSYILIFSVLSHHDTLTDTLTNSLTHTVSERLADVTLAVSYFTLRLTLQKKSAGDSYRRFLDLSDPTVYGHRTS